MNDRPTFSPFWHRVRAMRPRLRPHTQITRQHYRGRRWHVVQDPATNQYYRLNPIAYQFVSLLDGARTIEDAWKLSLGEHGDAAPTQNEVITLISQLYNANLLAVETTPETDQLLRRGRERFKKKAMSQAIGLMYFKMRLFNPDPLLTRIEPVLRPLLNKWGFLFWLAFVIFAAFRLAPEWAQLRSGVESAVAPANWGWMALVFVVTKAIHEIGHGVICKRFGGQVPEFGAMLLVLVPAPYVDASACWAFASKWKRIAVGAGGMIFELFIAAIAAHVWLATPQGELLHQIAYNAMLTAGISTVLFNANPLMRFDGYYILSDLLEVPNLMQRSTSMLTHLCQKHIYRLKDATPPTTLPGERRILLTYGVLALAYRIFLFISITLYVMGKLFAIGLVLAIWTGVMWFVLPLGKLSHWLAAHPPLAEHRFRAVATTLGLFLAAMLAVGAIPAPDRRRATGVVESEARTGIFAGANGFVRVAHVRAGDRVRAGDPIVTCNSPELERALEAARAMLEGALSQEREATVQDPALALVARERVAAINAQIAFIEDRLSRLIVRAPHDGTVVGSDPAQLVGAFAREGDGICEIVDESRVRVAALLPQKEAAWHFELGTEGYAVRMRSFSRPGHEIEGANVRVIDAGQVRLPHAALGFAGGGVVETQQSDKQGRMAKKPQFVLYVEPPAGSAPAIGAPGERVALRFHLPWRPLMAQWVDRLQKLVQGRVDV
ncbi:MAG: PqqD family peptide modification chaperone [Phycisphaeraceae bacterium]|nr:MAG: PqqD family peptide modification chaperone [Phycisphaeraceae bacterium]